MNYFSCASQVIPTLRMFVARSTPHSEQYHLINRLHWVHTIIHRSGLAAGDSQGWGDLRIWSLQTAGFLWNIVEGISSALQNPDSYNKCIPTDHFNLQFAEIWFLLWVAISTVSKINPSVRHRNPIIFKLLLLFLHEKLFPKFPFQATLPHASLDSVTPPMLSECSPRHL